MVKQSVKKRLTQILCIVLAALMIVGIIVIVLSGCSPDKVEDPTGSVNTTQNTTAAAPQDFPVLRDGSAICRVVRQDVASDGLIAAAVAIRRGVESAGGVLPDIVDDFLMPGEVADPDAYEILVGATNRPESSAVTAEFTNYASFSVSVVGHKIVVLASDDSGYASAAEWLCDRFYTYVDRKAGTLVLPAELSFSGATNNMLSTLPLYATRGRVETLWDCGDDCRMYIIKNTAASEYSEYAASLTGAGYEKYAENKIGDNLYATYTSPGGKYVLNTVYTAYEKKTRLIIEPLSKTELPVVETADTSGGSPVTVTQVGLEYLYDTGKTIADFQIGMLYIIRLRDGRFIIVDGGYRRQKNLDLFMDQLKKQAPDPENIKIAAWLLTHSHGDHVGLLSQVANTPSALKCLSVERFIYNFPSVEQYKKMEENYPGGVYSSIKMFRGAKTVKAHPGQRFVIGGAEIEYYSTVELVAPADCDTGNTVSAVFSVTAEGQKIMFLGDSSSTMTNVLVKCYGKALASDIVQVAHHGAHGGSVELYENIDMKVALWPLGVWDYYNYGGHGRKSETWNAYFYSSQKMMEIILAGHSERTITLPYEPAAKRFPADKEADYTP